MKNPNEYPFKVSAEYMNFIAMITVMVNVISEKFGTYPSYSSGGRYSRMEIMGIFVPLMILILPIFIKKWREKLWTANTIIISFITLIISTILIMIMYANKEYYWQLWFESGHWDRNNCPPIRWDFWNIIGETYKTQG